MTRQTNADRFARRMEAARAALAEGFSTKAAADRARADATAAHEAMREEVREACLATRDGALNMPADVEALYWNLPGLPHEWKPKHSAAVLAVFPAMTEAVARIEEAVALASTIKGAIITPKAKKVLTEADGARLQLRGHCQACGSQQAATDGRIAKHGYEVKFGFFSGTCHGWGRSPMEVSTDYTSKVAESLRAHADEQAEKAAKVRAGTIKPKTARASVFMNAEVVPFADAPAHMQEQAVAILAANLEGSARGARQHAEAIETLAAEVHGKPLAEVMVAK